MAKTEPDKARVHLTVSGRVQGVFYRAATREKAASMDVTGWVRNLDDGRVEIVAEGIRADLEELAAWCQEGPPRADVASVAASWGEATGEFTAFEIER